MKIDRSQRLVIFVWCGSVSALMIFGLSAALPVKEFMETLGELLQQVEVRQGINRIGALLLIAALAELFRVLSSPDGVDYSRKLRRVLLFSATVMGAVFIADWYWNNNLTNGLSTYLTTVFLFGFAIYIFRQAWRIRYRVPAAAVADYRESLTDMFLLVHKQIDEMQSDAPN